MAFFEGRSFVVILRAIQALLTVLILGLTGYVANWWGSYWHAAAPSQVAFLLFCAVLTLITLTYLIVVPMRFAESKLNKTAIIMGVEGLTMVFWFAGFVALAVFLSDRVCFGHVCSAAKAAAAFGAFQWLAFATTFGLALWPMVSGRFSGGIGSRSSAPKTDMAEAV